ncbi:uncharacterized protein LOC116023096 isoform X1 [Ipomoea triloba]|uniref:uncharacterized protein LOC116023096 isoform X1 n=1 Tax=Ipomoea triloba TaxID=35885 RepID=UPI00125E0447|nr:uncharacterized protein LOC116023096 isoform X1 [Ipomoea triloba]
MEFTVTNPSYLVKHLDVFRPLVSKVLLYLAPTMLRVQTLAGEAPNGSHVIIEFPNKPNNPEEVERQLFHYEINSSFGGFIVSLDRFQHALSLGGEITFIFQGNLLLARNFFNETVDDLLMGVQRPYDPRIGTLLVSFTANVLPDTLDVFEETNALKITIQQETIGFKTNEIEIQGIQLCDHVQFTVTRDRLLVIGVGEFDQLFLYEFPLINTLPI